MVSRGAATGRVLGVVSSASSAVLWVVFLLNPYGGQGGTLGTALVGCLMIVLAIVGIVASIQVRSLLLAVVAVISFMPVGLYMLGSPAVWKWIGVSEIVMFLAAIIMGVAKYSAGGGPRRSRT